MAEVTVADKAGACFGVERALRMVHEAAENVEGPVRTLGPLIHNPVVVDELAAAGVEAVKSPSEAPRGASLIMRAHGVRPEVEDEARAAGLTILDATCPFVKKVHRLAEKLDSEGYQVIVVGEKGHAEVEGTCGHAKGAVVVGSAADVEAIDVRRKVGVVAQTTLELSVLQGVMSALAGRCEELRVFNTICDATSERQAAAAELASRVDVMVVIGGRNSANTCHLADVCRAQGTKTYHIEVPEELDETWFAGADKVGITAGASTPAAHIEAVRSHLSALLSTA
ncbi:MAG: 4-hydroxy-3-methylbut-2-enyl diphosphate reductase [Coriobacteriales bacterium]|nr:4-hydroxy-3-methylbut-2-enyl diphosphate reductase [Coriobacteriales bacterium]